jgi:hypothetical protein
MDNQQQAYVYHIQVEGTLSSEWQDWFGGMQIYRQNDATILSGRLPDQTALFGILNRLASLNLALISLQRLSLK